MKDSERNYLQSRISSEIGAKVKVEFDSEGELELFIQKRVVSRHPIGDQISLSDAKLLDKKYKVGDVVWVPFERNMMVDSIISSALKSISEAEANTEKRKALMDKLLLEGITMGSLIFAKYVKSNMIGDAYFSYKDDVDAVVSRDDLMPCDRFEGCEGEEFPMIITNVEERPNKIVLSASRKSPYLTEELVYSTLSSLPFEINIVKCERVPGSRSIVVVDSPEVDRPALHVVGKGGEKVKTVQKYLNPNKGVREWEECIDIVNYSPSTPIMVRNLIGSVFVDLHFDFERPEFFRENSSKSSLNRKKLLIVIKKDKVGKVIGAKGSTLNMIARMVGWNIKVLDEVNFEQTFPNGMGYTSEFDWCGLEDLPEFARNFYGHYLHEIGLDSVVQCRGLSIEQLESIDRFSESDKKFIVDYFNGLEFSIECPNCKSIVSDSNKVCPNCGCSLE